ncbi:hypothetical protein RND81_11G068900 [Saponaria officinalis]|uniref:DUF8039 domain-containing protein n=1 Tax=Saponaria officinalis TaxID=3572 RepID=A0AAW1HJ44_SAPOF
MGRAGYSGKTEKWLNEEISSEKLKNPNADPIALQEIATKRLEDRSYKWIKGHTPSSSAPPPETQEVIDKIKHYDSLVKTGEFVPSRSEDVLVKATGKKEHPGRTRGVGSFVGNQKVFGKPPSRGPREKMYTAQEMDTLFEEVKKQTRAEMKNVFLEMAKTCGLILPNAFEDEGASNSSPPRQDQTSCHSVDQRDPFVNLKDPISCRLGVHDGNTLIVVAEGTARPWKENIVVHHTPLSPQNVHVSIDKCFNSTAPLPVPWSGFSTVGEAEGSFAQWPKKLVLLSQDDQRASKSRMATEDMNELVCFWSQKCVEANSFDFDSMFNICG